MATAPNLAKAAPSSRNMLVALAMMATAILLYLKLNTAVAAPGFTLSRFLMVDGILFLAGFMSGLIGFAFSAIGAAILLVIQPLLGVPLLQALSAANQMLSVGQLRAEMPKTWRDWWPYGPAPCIIGGLAGVPVGVWLLNNLPAKTLVLIFGSMIGLYAVYSIFKPSRPMLARFNGAKSGLVVGVIGGSIGGFTAFPGAAVFVWTSLRDLPKAQTRALLQPYILALQIVSLMTNAALHPHNFGIRFWTLLALTIPVVLPGTMSGVLTYRSVSEVAFKRFCCILLLISAIGLIAKAF
jgi:uncharacterized protein